MANVTRWSRTGASISKPEERWTQAEKAAYPYTSLNSIPSSTTGSGANKKPKSLLEQLKDRPK